MKKGKIAGMPVDNLENIFKAIFDNSIDPILITTPDGGIQSANPAACKLFGSTEDEIVKNGRSGVIDTTDPRLPGLLEERARTGKVAGELKFKRKDGSVFPTDFTSTVFKDANGKERTVIIVRDKTNLKIAEELIRKSEDKFRMLVSLSPSGIYMTDNAGRCTFVNEAWCKMAGMTIEEAYGDGWINAVHPADRELVSVLWNKYVNSGMEWNWSYRFVDKEGLVSWLYGLSKPIMDDSGKTIGFIGTNTDITELMLAEEKLKLSEEKFRLLSEQSGVGVALYSKDGIILYFNNKALMNLGGKLEDYIGKSLLEVFGEKDGKKYLKRIKEEIRLRKNVVYEDFFTSSTGSYWFSTIHSVFVNSSGEVTGVHVLSLDITERKFFEEQLKKTANELRELTRHMVEVREAERTTIARDLHDDLGQKLTALNMDISWLKTRIGVQSRTVEDKIQQMASVLNDSIDTVQKISYGLRPSILDDLGLLSALEWLMKDFIKTSGIECTGSFTPKEIEVDRTVSLMIFRIVQEALTNVVRHSKATKVFLLVNIQNRILEVTVRDNGTGIEKGKIDNPKSFGLAGMRERVTLVGGELIISGRSGKGTVIQVNIPLGA